MRWPGRVDPLGTSHTVHCVALEGFSKVQAWQAQVIWSSKIGRLVCDVWNDARLTTPGILIDFAMPKIDGIDNFPFHVYIQSGTKQLNDP